MQTEARSLTGFDGTRVEWAEIGAGEPLVISSPLGVPLWYWEPLIERLAPDLRIVFVKRRGLWGTEIPADLGELSVDAHARDLAAVIERVQPGRFTLLGFCSGIAPLLRSFRYGARIPQRVVLISGRYRRGASIAGVQMFEMAMRHPRAMDQLRDIIAAFSPSELRAALTEEFRDTERLRAHLHAIAAHREYDFTDSLPPGIEAHFLLGENDQAETRESTHAYVERNTPQRCRIVEIAGADHFFVRNRAGDVYRELRRILPVADAGAQQGHRHG